MTEDVTLQAKTSAEFEQRINQIEGRLMALEFIIRRAVAQQGPPSIQALLKNTEDAHPAQTVSPSVAEVAQEALAVFRKQMEEDLEQWAKQQANQYKEMAL